MENIFGDVKKMADGSISLGKIDGRTFRIGTDILMSSRTAVIGMTGSGKTDLVLSICEKLSGKDSSFVVIDPEGRFGVLKEKCEIVWAGKVPEADLLLKEKRTEKLAETIVTKGGRLVLDTSDCDDTREEMAIVTGFLEQFYKLQWDEKRPVLLVVGEADRFLGSRDDEKIDRLVEICKRGKKRNIGVLIHSHKPQDLDRSILSKFENQIIGRLSTKNDLEAMEQFFPSRVALDGLPKLKKGEFQVFGGFNPEGGKLEVKALRTDSKFDVSEFLDDVKEEVVRKEKEKVPQEEEEEEPGEEEGEEEDEEEEEIPTVEAVLAGKKKKRTSSKEEAPKRKKEKKRKEEPPEEIPSELIEVSSEVVDTGKGADLVPLDAELVDLEDDEDKDVLRGPPIRGLKFDISEEKALEIVKKEIKKTLIKRKTKETIEEIDAIYWPFFWCRMVKAKRFFFSLRSNNYYTVFDPVLLKFLKFKDEHDLKPLIELDNRLIRLARDGDHWREIRIIAALQKEDMTINDLVPASGLPRTELREALEHLRQQKLIKKAEDVGDTKMFMPTLQIKVPSLKDLKTKLPALATVRPKLDVEVMRPQYTDTLVRTLVAGFFKDVALIGAETFYLPFYRVQVMHRKKRTRRIMLVNARTGSIITLEDQAAEPFL
ncbi:MAG: DUF87 domain-containing protein [Candidatus Thermoplasmatota archaeon]|nr:DUF87 domain-containing protein [Candidatus Thermoplasmatota archaeon]